MKYPNSGFIAFSDIESSFKQQLVSTQLMCAAATDFKEADINRNASGKFSTEAEKAAKRKELETQKAAAIAAAPEGVVALPDGTSTYKMSKEEEAATAATSAGVTKAAEQAAVTAKTEPVIAVADLKKALEVKSPEIAAPEGKKVQIEKEATAKAQAVAAVTKPVADNMSDDQVRKGMIEVSKKLNSGKPSLPEEIMTMMSGWATEAKKNIDGGVKNIKTAVSDAKRKALATATGLMAKISEMTKAAQNSAIGKDIGAGLNAAKNSEAGKAVGNAFNATSKSIGDTYNATSKSVGDTYNAANKQLGDAAKAVQDSAAGKAVGDAYNATSKAAGDAKKAVGDTYNAANKQLGDAAKAVQDSAAGKAVGDAYNNASKAVGDAKKSAGDTYNAANKQLGDAAKAARDSAAGKAVGDAYNATSKAVGDGYNATSKAAGDTYNATSKAVGDGYNATSKAVGDGYNAASKAAGDTYNAANKQLGDAAKAARDSAAGKAVGDAYNAASKAAGDAKDAVGDTYNAASKSVGDASKATAAGLVNPAAQTAAKGLKAIGLPRTASATTAAGEKITGNLTGNKPAQGPANKTNNQVIPIPFGGAKSTKTPVMGPTSPTVRNENLGELGLRKLGDTAKAAKNTIVEGGLTAGNAIAKGAANASKTAGDAYNSAATSASNTSKAVGTKSAELQERAMSAITGKPPVMGPTQRSPIESFEKSVERKAGELGGTMTKKDSPMKKLGDAAKNAKK